jgi:hypothetical protein
VRLTLLFVAAVAAAQNVPKSPCDFDGFDIDSQLAEVAAPATAYFGCGTGKCLPMSLKAGDPVVITRMEGDWTCGYLVAQEGSAQGWLRSRDLRPLTIDLHPPSEVWVGTWAQGENRIAVLACWPYAPAVLTFDAKSYWRGPRNNVHTGQLYVRARPFGNRVQLDDQMCKIELTWWGKYLLANDNNLCGGVNVRFWGIWKRSPVGAGVSCD